MRGRDLVALGVDGTGSACPCRAAATGSASRSSSTPSAPAASPISRWRALRRRAAATGRRALADDPRLLLCDEPLTSLDLANQQAVVRLIDDHRKTRAAVLLVTHDINPVLGKVDRILYIANGRFTLGRPKDVLTSPVLTDLYGAPVFVLRTGDRLVVVGAPDAEASHHHHDHEAHA